MRRQGAFLCSGFCFGIFFAYGIDVNFKETLFLVGLLCLLFIVGFFLFELNGAFKNAKPSVKRIYAGTIVLFFLGNLYFSYNQEYCDYQLLQNGEVDLVGIISHEEVKGKSNYKIEIEVKEVLDLEEKKIKSLKSYENLINQKILVKFYGKRPFESIGVGKTVEVKGKLTTPEGRRNPKVFDYKNYLKSKKIFREVKAYEIKLCENEKYDSQHKIIMNNIKENYKKYLYQNLTKEEAGLVYTMTFGGNNNIDTSTYDKFQKNGICHILAVSGLHVGAIYLLINILFLRRKTLKIYIFTFLLVMFYGLLSEMAPSVMRAVVIIFFHLFAQIFNKKFDFLTSGVITMIIMLIINPFQVYSLGFKFSFLAFGVIVIVIPVIKNKFNNKIAESIVFTVIMNLSMAPMIAYYFNIFSWSSFLVSIPAGFIAGIIVPLSIIIFFVQSILSWVLSMFGDIRILFDYLGTISDVLSVGLGSFSEMLIFLNDIFFVENLSYTNMISPYLWFVLGFYGILFLLCSEKWILWSSRKENLKKVKSITAIMLVVMLINFYQSDGFEDADVIFLDVGQGDCMFFKTEDGKNIMIDSGGRPNFDVGEKIIKPFCLKNGIKNIDLCIISHLHLDHMGGVTTLKNTINVDRIAVFSGKKYEDDLGKKFKNYRGNFEFLSQGDVLKSGNDFEIEVLAPRSMTKEEYVEYTKGKYDENLMSLVLMVKIKDRKILVTGDISKEIERDILEKYSGFRNYLDIDVLKVAHHGSNNSSCDEFLKKTSPEVSIIQVGKNNYGHPGGQALGRLKKFVKEVYRNDLNGAIGLTIANDKIAINTMINE